MLSFNSFVPAADEELRRQAYDAWIVVSAAFNHPPLKHLAEHPI